MLSYESNRLCCHEVTCLIGNEVLSDESNKPMLQFNIACFVTQKFKCFANISYLLYA